MLAFSTATLLVAILLQFDHYFTKFQYQCTNGVGLYVAHHLTRRSFGIGVIVLAIMIHMQYDIFSMIAAGYIWFVMILCLANASGITIELTKGKK